MIVDFEFQRGHTLLSEVNHMLLKDDRSSPPFTLEQGSCQALITVGRSGALLMATLSIEGDPDRSVTWHGSATHHPRQWRPLKLIRNNTGQKWSCRVKVVVTDSEMVVQPK